MATTQTARPWFIYTLSDPRTQEIRYIGWRFRSAEARLRQHMNEAVQNNRTHRERWIVSLLNAGTTPVMETIDSGTGGGYQDAEKRAIAHYRSLGFDLVNGTDGGDGTPGWGTPERRSEAVKRGYRNRTPENHAARMAKAIEAIRVFQGAKTPEERRAWMARARAFVDPEKRIAHMKAVRAKATPEMLRAQGKKLWEGMTPEQRSALNSARSKKFWAGKSVEERRAAMSAARAKVTPEQRSAMARYAVLKFWEGKTPEERSAIAREREMKKAERKAAL